VLLSLQLDIFTPPLRAYLPPQIIGTESAGKSSILESITKCAIFPRGAKVVTMCPVRFELVGLPEGSDTKTEITWRGEHCTLKTPEDILAQIKRYFDSLQGEFASRQACFSGSPTPRLPNALLDVGS
jgi:hypothetical protein